MPKMQVYLPDDLYDQLKRAGAELNVSGILQDALVLRLAQIERLRLLGEALAEYEAENGAFSVAELDAREVIDKQSATRPKVKRKRQPAA